MKKSVMRKLQICLCFILLTWVFAAPMQVSADIGPKPSVVVKFAGLEDEIYYVTLLSEKDSTGPWSLGNDYYDYMGDEEVFNKFSEYEDEDGYFFLSFMEDCSEDDTFEWTYYPPSRFKILIYLPEYDQFLTEDAVYERYAFDSYFTVDVNGAEVTAAAAELETKQSYDFAMETLSLVVRVVLTICVEVALAWIFTYRDKKSLTIIACTNIVTQILLNVLLNVINYKSGQWAFVLNYIWMELVIFGIEAAVYHKAFGGTNPFTGEKYHHYWYAFVANMVSFAVGMWIARAIPGIF